jgi:SET domain-containing protein
MIELNLLSDFTVKNIIKNGVDQLGLFTKKNIKKGSIILKLQGKVLRSPTKYTIQIAKDKHIIDQRAIYINHSCNPNIKVINIIILALRDICKSEEITFNYNDNEDILASPFVCSCCGKKITGRIYSKA